MWFSRLTGGAGPQSGVEEVAGYHDDDCCLQDEDELTSHHHAAPTPNINRPPPPPPRLRQSRVHQSNALACTGEAGSHSLPLGAEQRPLQSGELGRQVPSPEFLDADEAFQSQSDIASEESTLTPPSATEAIAATVRGRDAGTNQQDNCRKDKTALENSTAC
jgi:hypothetical protein